MRHATLMALGLMFVSIWSLDSARGQSSASPPVSLAPPNVSPPHTSAKGAKPKGEPALVTNNRASPATTGREPSPPVIGGPAATPNPAVDYDGFSVGNQDNDAPDQAMPPVRPRAVKKGSEQQAIDQEDEALKRKLTICKNCK